MSAVWKVLKRTKPGLLDHLCEIRGFTPSNLKPDFQKGLLDPFELKGMKEACKIIKDAKDNNKKVIIFGDYDADGTPASVLLSDVLDFIGIKNTVMLPTRQMGYGLKGEILDEIKKNSDILITVDTGISSVDEIEILKNGGIKTIIIDHHLPKEKIPKADAIIDPMLKDDEYPFKGMCGCALAFKFVCALGKYFPEIDDKYIKWQLDLVAISTVADMVPLVGENRTLAHYGLIVINHKKRPGIKAMLEAAGLEDTEINSTTLGYVIGPRLNASGRLNDNWPAYNLLKAKDLTTARKFAYEVEESNRKRQNIVENTVKEAESLIYKQNKESDHIFILYKDDWSPGVIGLVAGKILQKYNRPVIVASRVDGQIRGSARSIKNFHITDGIGKYNSLVHSYGGHKQAAGLTVDNDNWPKFVDSIKSYANINLKNEDLLSTSTADALLENDEININIAKTFDELQPFGIGNPKPLLIIRNVFIDDIKKIGKNSTHLSLDLKKDDLSFRGIGFGLAQEFEHKIKDEIQLLGYLEVNKWMDKETVQFKILETLPSSANIETIENGEN